MSVNLIIRDRTSVTVTMWNVYHPWRA